MELSPEELLFAAMLRLAMRDATRAKSEQLRAEASAWLWTIAPCVAKRAGVREEADLPVALVSGW